MTRTHILAVTVAVALSGGATFAQTPAPLPAPAPPAVPPSPPRAAPLRIDEAARDRLAAAQDRAAAGRDRLEAERDRIVVDRDRIADAIARAQDAVAGLRDFQASDFHFDIPDFHFDVPDFHFDVPDFHFDIPDVDVDAQLEALRSVDLEEVTRNAREIAEAFARQAPFPAPIAPRPPAPPEPPRAIFVERGSPEGLYDQARGYIDRDQYERALESLNRLIAMKGDRADAAMYWKAYSLSKLARNAEALTTLAEMRKQFPNSSWIREVGFLELEIRQASGQAVGAEAQVSEDMKLLALQGIMRSDPESAIPIVEKTLAGNSSVRVKERALFVLSQSRVPRAREVITGVAKGASNPDLKVAAIRYMGRTSGPEVLQALEEIYRSTSDVEVKRAVLQALYTARATDRLGSIARNEKDADLRRTAVRQLGSSNTPEGAEALRAIYVADSNAESRRAVIDALSASRAGAPALVALARAEKDPTMKTEIVRRLSNMRAPEAREYMLELLK
jgi:tetratricopeptide (TPR) repeat protein